MMPATIPTKTDSAAEFYLVPNKNGPGKSLIRRVPPPPSVAPLPDDFDAMTTGGQSTYTRGGRGHGTRPSWETHGRTGASPRAGSASVSPLDDDFDATYTAGATLTRKAGSSMDGYGDVKSWLKGSESSPGRSTGRYHGRGSSEEYTGEQRSHMDDIKRRLAGDSPNRALTPTRNRKELSRNGSLNKERNFKIERISPPARLGSIPRPAPPPVNTALEPKPANEFQEINRRILEDGPEKTVLISTWREQVADAAETQTVVDVYYLNEDDYAEAQVEENQQMTATTTRRASLPPPPPSAPSMIDGEGSEFRAFADAKSITESSFVSERGPTVPPKSSNRSFRSELARERSLSGASLNRTAPPPRTITPESSSRGHIRQSSNNSSGSLGKLPNGRSSLPLNVSVSPPRSSTPGKNRQDPSFLAGRSSRNLHQPITPSEMYATNPIQPGPSFRTNADSASTISTIKSASVTAFEDVLSSCEPSLLHISPALTSLGITNESHLKAITKMNEETRDRVLKEEALRQGVTVMEWAILLDRIHTL